MERLKRKIDNYLIEWKNNPDKLPLIVKGARQIGKTNAIRNFGKNNYKSFIEINFVFEPEFKSIFSGTFNVNEILKEIKVAQNIVILTHESPDGDAIGSSLAMRLMLKELEKECDVIIPEYSRLFDFLPGIETIKKESEIKNYDLAIAVDCADIKRIAKKEYFENAKYWNDILRNACFPYISSIDYIISLFDIIIFIQSPLSI